MIGEECLGIDKFEDEQEIQVNSNGSVLMPSDSPYDKYAKIKEANDELFTTVITKPRSLPKVRFSSEIVTHSLDYDELFEETILPEITEGTFEEEEIDINSSTDSSSSSSTIICKPTKVLLVTVPTAFTTEIYDGEDEEGDDEDDQEDEQECDEDYEEYCGADTADEEEIVEDNNVIDDLPENDSIIGNVSEDDEINTFKSEENEKFIEEDLSERPDIITPTTTASSSPMIDPIYRHKGMLTKDSRIEEYSDDEDSFNNVENIDIPDVELNENIEMCNSISIDELTQNLNEIKISTQIEEIDDNLEKAVNNADESADDHGFNNSLGGVINKKKEKKFCTEHRGKAKKSNSLMSYNQNQYSSVPLNIRAHCPIFKRTQGYIAQIRHQLSNSKSQIKHLENRPSSAPAKRHCCNYWDQRKLPNYNGLRSEYGLTAEQLSQRKREKNENTKSSRLKREKQYLEELQKQKENDLIFNSWLVKKKRAAAQKFSRRKLQSTFQLNTIAAPTNHLEKVSALRKKLLKREQTSYSLEEFFKHANPHEQKTYRIYLGLCME